jgi:dipeptidase
MKHLKVLLISILIVCISIIHIFSCTVIVVGKKASTDGSVIVSQTDNGDDSRIRIFPAADHKKGEMVGVYWGIQRVDLGLFDLGEKIGEIPQVEHTYQYFLSAYSHMNEHQLAMAESTTSMRGELKCTFGDGDQIMTIEQAQIFALQRCKTAKEALDLIGDLMTTYGFLPSCISESESLVIADPNEAWLFEVISVGAGWKKDSGKPGAVWAAQRIPDDHVMIVPNWSVIKEIDPNDTDNFRTSDNYLSFAVEKGWYDPTSNKPFIWQDVYAPTPREWATGRFWLFYSQVAPNYTDWPDRYIKNPYESMNPYIQYVEPLSMYPFSIKPEKKLSVKDVIAFQRSVFEGTIYDMSEDPDWYIPDGEGKMYKSPLATPFPTREMRKLLDITWRRNVARGGYGMVAQLRSWLPDPIGGLYWVYQDNEHPGIYVPIYAGVTKVNPVLFTYDPQKFSDKSLRWAIDFVDNLLYLKWQEAFKDVQQKRDPLEQRFFDQTAEIDKKAAELYKKKPAKAKEIITNWSFEKADEAMALYKALRYEILTKYTNNKQGINF